MDIYCKQTALNKRQTLRRLTAARATKKPVRAVALCGLFLRHIFAVAGIASQFLYRNSKNVFYLNSLCEIVQYKGKMY